MKVRMLREFYKRLFCKHDYVFLRNVYGDEIIHLGYKRSIWKCKICGKTKFGDELGNNIKGEYEM